MSLAIFRKVVQEMQGYPHAALRIFARGEPLLHPDIVAMVRIAKQEAKLPVVSVITNGLRLQGEIAASFIRDGLDVVEVSLDALTEASYRTVRPLASKAARERTSPFQTIVENVLSYVEMRERLNPSCKIVVSIIDQPLVRQEVEAFIQHWETLVDRVLRRKFHSFQGRVPGIALPEKRPPCRILWSRFNVHSNGDVPLCYNDWKNEDIIGNLADPDTTIASLWRHPTYERYRQLHQQQVFPGICTKCQDWTGASWELPYEKVFTSILPAKEVAS
jgi:radical SAM protein with 4Fe4S-binding SPASM domain